MSREVKIAVLGGGSWGTAIVKMLTENLDTVYWYMRNTNAIEYIKKEGHNPNYLTSVELHTEYLKLTDRLTTKRQTIYKATWDFVFKQVWWIWTKCTL